jgi:outer membrane protein OmpA-like peptidoglycan-associated protein
MMAGALRSRRTLVAVVAAVVVAGALLGASIPGAQAGLASPRQDGGEPRVRDLIYRWRDLDDAERVEQGAEETTVTLSDEVLFEFDRADLRPAAATRLDELAGALRELGPRTVTIVGHTDNRGEPAYNQNLSQRRAESVRTALADRLGSEFTFEASGKGETEPTAPNENEDGSDNPEGRALNRRVEITYPS